MPRRFAPKTGRSGAGRQRDLVWRETGLVDVLPAGKLPRVWSAPIGSGYAGPAVADGRVYVADRMQDDNVERVLCFNADNGKPLWTVAHEAEYGKLGLPAGPAAKPTVDGNRVYVLGAVGHLSCLDAESGNFVWKRDLSADFA